MAQLLNFSDMITWLREDLQTEGYRILDTYDKDPKLPIDLFCVNENNKGIKYLIVLVASIDDISDEFQKKLFFFQYYVSSHHDPNSYAIALAVPSKSKVNTVPFYAETPEDKKDDFYIQQGFGLWKIKNKNEINKTSYPAIPLRQKISYDYKKIIAKKDPGLIKATSKILLFVDIYIHDSVKGITAFNPPKFNEKYIDYRLLEKSLSMNKISYCDCLCDGVSDYLSHKDDDFEFSTKIIKTLWNNCVPHVPYPEIHRKFESLLKEINPRYRDHYIHQFQVFLFGALIIDILRNNNKINENFKDLCIGWLLTATFHDVNYPVQEHDSFIKEFFNQTLGITHPFGLLDFKTNYTECQFSSNIELILDEMTDSFKENCTCEDICVNHFNKVREFFYYNVTFSKNHGVLSGLGLLKKFENQPDLENVLIPAAAAIAFHDDSIWQPLNGQKIEKNKDMKWIKNVIELEPLKKIDFKTHPLSFLLILCDNIQDWGRHCRDVDFECELNAANIRLKDIFYSKDELTIQLYIDQNLKSIGVIDYKMKTLGKIQKLLKSPDVKFKIEFWDRQKDEITQYIFNFS
jgi:hypothetical protein